MRLFSCMVFAFYGFLTVTGQPSPKHDFTFPHLSTTWDEGLPIGNAHLGALIWQKNEQLRLSLDRSDLWDLRPTEGIKDRNWQWVIDHVQKGDYKPVQDWGDVPYEANPAPTKLPGAGLNFPTADFGRVISAHLRLEDGLATVVWDSGVRFTAFVHAQKDEGWFRFEHLKNRNFAPILVPPSYQSGAGTTFGNSVEGSNLETLGYTQGQVQKTAQSLLYVQKGWGTFQYRVSIRWLFKNGILTGVWSISAHSMPESKKTSAEKTTASALQTGWQNALTKHRIWWKTFWNRARINLPDERLERQYYRDMYKFGATARPDAPPISLQAVWTADNGKLPPWKGDFHHNLNTQLSYWPGYAGNQTDLTAGFTNWLWQNKSIFERWTKQYFGTDGLNVPGVTTLHGEPMGGWIQYSLSPTMGAWTAHHFYLQWRYTMDKTFLREKAYPFIRGVARHFDQIGVNKNGKRQLPLSSSPELHDNSINAWFTETTNFDLSLIRWTYAAAIEMAENLGLNDEKAHWIAEIKRWPDLEATETGLTIAPGHPQQASHRHFSHLLAIHPLSMYDFNTDNHQEVMLNSLNQLEKNGTDWWTGYSFAWLANLYARAKKGDEAAQALQIFADCFVLSNSFHANGTQCKGQYSKFEYRPFTLEGNFASAAGVQEMLLQSHHKTIEVFPAIPTHWKNVSFQQLRAEGAFLVSATLENGKVKRLRITSEKGGETRLRIAPVYLKEEQRTFLTRKFPEQRIKLKAGESFVLE
ncbi:MAG: hypothetical protein J0L94_11885 [Rhodothermia bacterium]|nr:hypothetical protein [Rhodothermia bacterium]